MIILCGNRRLVSYKYGWTIQIKHTKGKGSKNSGEIVWKEEQPAYPSTIPQGLYMIYERILKDSGEFDVTELAEQCKAAAEQAEKYADQARAAGEIE